jgi:anti-sigma B factor antagonist
MSGHAAFASRFEIDDPSRVVVVSLSGDLDPGAVEDLHPQIQELVWAGYRRFVFDLSELSHLGSIALRLFVALANQLKGDGSVVLCAVGERIRALIDLTGVDRILRSYPTRADAVEAVREVPACKPPIGLAAVRPLTSRVASGQPRRPRRP